MNLKPIAQDIVAVLSEKSLIIDNEYQSACNAIYIILGKYEIREKEITALVPTDIAERATQMFFVSKKVEGMSDTSIAYYSGIIRKFSELSQKPVTNISSDDIRVYLARRFNAGVSNVTIDNELRILKSFFSWLTAEGYIAKSPTVGIKAVKKTKVIKKPFTEIEIEKLRAATKTAREKALLEVLYSTGARVSEVAKIEKSEIVGDTVVVLGKGGKERVVFLNARALFAIAEYLEERTDDHPSLFVTMRGKAHAISKGTIEKNLHTIGERAGVANVHPHRFRRTTATLALNRGMPIEQVKQLLGHEKIETTTIYARSDIENVKASHRKFVV